MIKRIFNAAGVVGFALTAVHVTPLLWRDDPILALVTLTAFVNVMLDLILLIVDEDAFS